MSHGSKEIPAKLVKTMMKQLKFESFKEFEDFIDCPLTFDDYVARLKKREYL